MDGTMEYQDDRLIGRDFFVDTDQVVHFTVTACGPSFITLGFPRPALIAGLGQSNADE